jgi:hypothetical protein
MVNHEIEVFHSLCILCFTICLLHGDGCVETAQERSISETI